jgi:hypothetical protein
LTAPPDPHGIGVFRCGAGVVEKVEQGSTNEFAQMTDEQLRDFIILETRALGMIPAI